MILRNRVTYVCSWPLNPSVTKACGSSCIFDKYISEIGHYAVLFVYIPVLTGFDHVRFL